MTGPAAQRALPDGSGAALPEIIQGGMGIGVSGPELARAVAVAGQLGVVSGVALDTILVRRLQLGDPDEVVRNALSEFPLPAIAERIIDRYFVDGGIPADRPFALAPRWRVHPSPAAVSLSVAANFVAVSLAKAGHVGLVGVNYLEKIQMSTPASVLGAMLAGVDVVLMGAGIPAEIPRLLDDLSAGERGSVRVSVEDAGSAAEYRAEIDPAPYLVGGRALVRPAFLAIVANHVLAQFLARDTATRPDGFVVEGPTAGGHSAPPRGRSSLDEHGQPVYGDRDRADVASLRAIGLPYWLAGGYGAPEGLVRARAAGAAGVQVGSIFALCNESGIDPVIRAQLLRQVSLGELVVHNDPRSSPTGFPFKVAGLPATLADPKVAAARRRVCDLGYLRVAVEQADGQLCYRCAGEPVTAYRRKGGSLAETEGRHCLCNGLLAAVGLAQRRPANRLEPPIVTLGQELDCVRGLLGALPAAAAGYGAADVVRYLLDEP